MSPTVLVIDDEVQIRRLLRIVLEGAGYKVVQAENGILGIQQAAGTRPDMVLLDMGLPDLSGLEVLARLREWSRVPVIVLTVQNDIVLRGISESLDNVHSVGLQRGAIIGYKHVLLVELRHLLKGVCNRRIAAHAVHLWCVRLIVPVTYNRPTL